MSLYDLIVVAIFGLTFVIGQEATQTENVINSVQDVKCPHIPCPLPPNCTHYVWSHFMYHGKLCKGCQYCANTTQVDEDVKCPHLPCPYPGNCSHYVWSHFWYHGKLCKGCQFCDNTTLVQSDETSPSCLPLPCPPPGPGCTKTKMTHYWNHGKLCPGCPLCVYWNVTQPSDDQQSGPRCLALPCAPPRPGCVKLELSHYWRNGLLCPGCQRCVD